MKRLFLVGLVAALGLTFSCSPDTSGQPSGEPRRQGAPSTELATDYEFEPYPGNRWYAPDGREIPDKSSIVNAITGPDHCDWESGVMMHLGWPLGHDAADISETRQYIRDPQKVFPQRNLMTTFDADTNLLQRAEYTGYRTDFMELWLDDDDETAAYLVFADHIERWPRASDAIACA